MFWSASMCIFSSKATIKKGNWKRLGVHQPLTHVFWDISALFKLSFYQLLLYRLQTSVVVNAQLYQDVYNAKERVFIFINSTDDNTGPHFNCCQIINCRFDLVNLSYQLQIFITHTGHYSCPEVGGQNKTKNRTCE